MIENEKEMIQANISQINKEIVIIQKKISSFRGRD